MKISAYNFKSIGSLVHYELLPLTILSGTNSSGKSSFIQLLLLLKQTIEVDSGQFPLYLEGKLFPVKKYKDILNSTVSGGKLKVEFIFNKAELEKYKLYHEISFYEVFDNYDLLISFEFDTTENTIYVSTFEVKFLVPAAAKQEQFIRTAFNSGNFFIDTNVAVFSNSELYTNQGFYKIHNIKYSSFFPFEYEIEYPESDGSTSKEVLKLDGIKVILRDFLGGINYIGPSRDEPKEEYKSTGNYLTVGVHGTHVAEVLEKLSNDPITFIVIKEENETVEFIEQNGTFLEAVRYWMCERFHLCSDIYSSKIADSYAIYVKNFAGIESTIRHVGFGISQILPVVVEGLLLATGGTLILEQPEVHLHPKVQSQLFDFLISLVQLKKKVIVETHSDHLITRLRRRIAEDASNTFNKMITLTFVEPSQLDLIFRNIGIDDFGGLDYFPEDFIEKVDVELKAILKAQMKKRLNKKEQ